MNTVTTLRKNLKNGIAHFTYKKVNGELREAYGTTKKEFAGDDFETPQSLREPRPNLVTYWDIDECGWRSFKEENFVEILD